MQLNINDKKNFKWIMYYETKKKSTGNSSCGAGTLAQHWHSLNLKGE